MQAIEEFAKRVKENNWAAVIFPEGTRSRDGNPKPFKTKGLKSLITQIPNAQIVPLTINNSWKMLRYGKFPMGLGANLKFTAHQTIDAQDYNIEDLIILIEKQITQAIDHD